MIKIDLYHFRAVIHAAATKDVRYYLNGVNVRGTKGSTTVTVSATNGHMLAVTRQEQEQPLADDVDFTIAIEDAKEIAKINPGRHGKWEVILPAKPVDTKAENTAVVNHVPLLFGIITDGKFPDIERVISDVKPVENFEGTGFNTGYLADLDRMRRGLGIKTGSGYVSIRPTGHSQSAYRITFPEHDNFLVVLMPCRV